MGKYESLSKKWVDKNFEARDSLFAKHKDYNLNVTAEIEGKKLNRSYGLIGGEQHLFRFPGDTLLKHAENAEDVAMYLPSGIVPGLGAWGYFSFSNKDFTKEDMLNERYYIAVQTFLQPYNQNRHFNY
ncbi:MAG: hypothetical protein ABIJ36_01155 [Patescibacteria group bacterium]